MRANPFEGELERLVRTLTDQFGVQVTCQGDNAWTDGRKIVLPSVPEPMDEGLERMMLGYLDHEMAHVAFSDFRVAAQFEKKHPGCLGLLNVVEDALIERRAMQRWPGVRRNLDGMFAQVRDRVISLIARRGPFDRFCTAVYLRLAHHKDMLGLEREVQDYTDLLDRFAQVRTTRDSAGLSEQLLHRWRQKNPPPPKSANQRGSETGDGSKTAGKRSNPNQQSSGDQGQPDQRMSPADDSQDADRPDDGHSNGSFGGEAGDDSADTGPDREADGADEAGAQDSCANSAGDADEDGGAKGGGPRATSGQGGSLISQAVAEAIATSMARVDCKRQYRAFTKQHDRIDVVPKAAAAEVAALLGKGKDTVRRLRRGLTNALRSAEKRWWRDDQVRGELSPRTLYRLCMDRTRVDVFRTRSTVQGKSTAICIVLDASGSMTNSKMEVARAAVRVLLEALAELKIAAEAFTFTTGNAFDLNEACKQTGMDMAQMTERFGRLSNLEIGLIKRFEEPVKAALERLPSIKGTGLTPLGEAMQIGASRLIARPENRKIVLVLTDGKAGCEGRDNAAVVHAQHVASRIAGAGIELVGVGILDDNIREIVSHAIVIHKLEELPAQLCKLLGRTLKKGMCHAE